MHLLVILWTDGHTGTHMKPALSALPLNTGVQVTNY